MGNAALTAVMVEVLTRAGGENKMRITMERRQRALAIGFAVGAMLAIAALGCRGRTVESRGGTQAGGAISLVDALGREVRLERPVQRVISLAPSITEILFALGLGNRVVGVTTWDDYPPEVAQIQRVGDYGNPSLEKIVWLKPDLILVTYGVPKPSIEALEKHGLTVMALPDDSLADVVKSVRMVGKACGVETMSGELASRLKGRIGAVQLALPSEPVHRPKVLYLVSLQPLMCAGAGTFIDDMIRKAGGENLGAGFGDNYPTPSAELLLAFRPDVLLLGEHVEQEACEKGGQEILHKVGLSSCRTCTLPDDLIQRPGPRAIDGLELMVEALYPESRRRYRAGDF